jgi:centromeric protein E
MELQAEVTHLKEQLSQALEAKDLLSNSIIKNNVEVNHDVEHHANQEEAVRDVCTEPPQKQQQVCFLCSCFHHLYSGIQGYARNRQ